MGLGVADPGVNPLVAGDYPILMQLTGGIPLIEASGRVSTAIADIIPLDARMGVPGRPQSATGQAALLTGRNAPAAIGEHYGPRPDDRVRSLVREGNLFATVLARGLQACFCNAYPHGFFEAVARGKRLLSVIQFAAESSGLRLRNRDDLVSGNALSADYTNADWRTHLDHDGIPVYEPEEAGVLFWQLSLNNGFTLHDHWMTDVLGHRRNLDEAVRDLQVFDRFLGGLLNEAQLDETLIVIASDHGNVEDCSHGKHTLNPALCILVGDRNGLQVDAMRSLDDLAPVIEQALRVKPL